MKKFYVTTSIAYTNAQPHVGFALELLQADVLARYHRQKGEDVLFLTGTDEHGSKIARTAERAGKSPLEFCNEISEKFKELKPELNLSNDDFIRTTDQKKHWPTVHKVWQQLKDNDDIYKKKYKGLYCVGCEAFLTKKDLVDGKCPNHKKEPEVIEEENWFFKLSKYQGNLKDILENNKIKIFPEVKKNEMLNFIKQGLEDVSCSRDKRNVSWGVPVPGDDNQRVYVWFEALLNYISALGYAEGDKKFKQYWPVDVHCIGKDLSRFHLLLWPAMLIALDLELPKNVLIHGFFTVDGEKMSKSIGNVIDPVELVEKYGTDPVRYFLLREISSTEDGDFTTERFESRYKADLANGIGNLLSRATKLAENNWNGIVPEIDKSDTGHDGVSSSKEDGGFSFNPTVRAHYGHQEEAMEKFRFNDALSFGEGLVGICDSYIEHYKPYKPSEMLQDDEKKINIIIYDVLETIRHIAWMFLPFMPDTADKIFEQLGLDPKKEKAKSFDEAKKWGGLEPGTKIKKGESLFPRL